MKEFQGFPARMEFTAIPNIFFSGLLPQINDIAELKTILYVMAMLYRKKGYPRFVSQAEIAASSNLKASLMSTGQDPEETLRSAMAAAVARKIFIHLPVEKDGRTENIYLLNDAPSRQALEKIKNGELTLKGLKTTEPMATLPQNTPDIFTLYEQNIGLLTPLIAEQITDAQKNYPEAWIREAIKEAVNHGKRKWSYIAAILQHWATEGKSDGTYQRHSEKTDPDRFIKGKYGHMVQR